MSRMGALFLELEEQAIEEGNQDYLEFLESIEPEPEPETPDEELTEEQIAELEEGF